MKIKISTRVVLLIGKYAIKIPIDRRGYLQGKNEKAVWKSGKCRKLLAPLVWSRFGIVIQKRCTEINYFVENYVFEIKNTFPHMDFYNCDLYNHQNWGIYQGRQVLIDYGIDESISKMY